MIDEFFIREAVRGRGMGAQAIDALAAELAGRGVVAMHVEAVASNPRAQSFYARRGFATPRRPSDDDAAAVTGLGIPGVTPISGAS